MKNNEKNHYKPTLYHFLKPFIGISLLIVLGTVSYMHIENWNLLDSLFMSVETLTTVGYGFVKPLSQEGRIFTIIYIIFGVTVFLYLAAEFAEHVFMANFDRTFKKKTMENKIKKLNNHFIVCGFGRTGSEIAAQLAEYGLNFVIVDKEPTAESMLLETNYLHFLGDATDDKVLEKAGIHKAKGIFCALNDDADNLYLTLCARDLKANLNIIARCVKASNEQKFLKAGATSTILPYEICARRMVSSVVKPHVVDFLDVVMHTKGHELELKLEQFLLRKESSLDNKKIIDSKIREKTGVIVVALKRGDQFFTNPSPDTILKADDHIIAIGTNQQLSELQKIV